MKNPRMNRKLQEDVCAGMLEDDGFEEFLKPYPDETPQKYLDAAAVHRDGTIEKNPRVVELMARLMWQCDLYRIYKAMQN